MLCLGVLEKKFGVLVLYPQLWVPVQLLHPSRLCGLLALCASALTEDAGGELLALHPFFTLCWGELGLCWHLEPSSSSFSLSSSSPSAFVPGSSKWSVCFPVDPRDGLCVL